MKPESWQKTYFNRYYRVIHSHQTEQLSRQEAEHIVRLLGLTPGSLVLDLGSGYGRHVFQLAKLGMKTVGIDTSQYFIRQARLRTRRRGPKPRFIFGDFRKLRQSKQFDAIISIYTSFGFYSDEENLDVLRRVARALKVGGQFLIDINNHDKLVADVEQCAKTWRQLGNGNYVIDNFAYDPVTQRCNVRRNLVMARKILPLTFEFRSYTYQELEALLLTVGLRPRAVFGSLDGSPLTIRSSRLVVVAKKTD